MDENPSFSEMKRRNQMKDLFTSLNSLVQPDGSNQDMGSTSESDQIERATDHIKKMQFNLEKMKQKKKCLIEEAAAAKRSDSAIANIHVMGTAIEVVLRTDLNGQFMFNEIIRMAHEEGAEVVTATYSVTDDAIFHSIHLKIGEIAQEQEAARITARLRKFVHGHGCC